MSSSPISYCQPEVKKLLDETLGRAAAFDYFFFETSSESKAYDAILETFRVAATTKEVMGEGDLDKPVLDLDEARLAVSALHLTRNGEDLIITDEARMASRLLRDTLRVVMVPRVFHSFLKVMGGELADYNYANWLIQHDVARAKASKRHSKDEVEKQIESLYLNPKNQVLDARCGLDPVDAIFISFALSFRAGAGTENTILGYDTLSAGLWIDVALAKFRS